MMIGIICALDIEAAKLKSLLEEAKTERVGRLEFVSGVLAGRDVVLGRAGVGKVNAAMCTEAMILKYSPDLILNSGVAGSLSAALTIGDIAVGTGVVEHDFDTTAFGDPPGFFTDLGLDCFPTDPDAVAAILAAAGKLGIPARPARIASGDQFVSDAAIKARLVACFGAEACEMEAGAIAHVCYSNGVKCAIIRAISDSTDGAHHMEFYENLPLGADSSANVVLEFLRRS